jgi:hypothetical protein
MDRNFGFGRLEPLGAAVIGLPARGVTAALAEELFFAHPPATDWHAPKPPCAAPAKQRQKLTYAVAAA